MASKQDTQSRKGGSSQEEMYNNHQVALSQGEKSSFRVHKVALSADKFNPARLNNVIQHTLKDN